MTQIRGVQRLSHAEAPDTFLSGLAGVSSKPHEPAGKSAGAVGDLTGELFDGRKRVGEKGG